MLGIEMDHPDLKANYVSTLLLLSLRILHSLLANDLMQSNAR